MDHDIDQLIDDLEHPDHRLGAIKALSRHVALTVTMGTEPDVRAMAQAVRARCLQACRGGRFLDDPDPEVRAMVLGLWDLMRAQEEVRKEVLALLHDANPIVRSTAIFTTARLGEVDQDSVATIRERLGSLDMGERFASAFCLAILHDESDRHGVAKALLEGAVDVPTLADSLRGCPYLDDGVSALATHALAELGPVPDAETREFLEAARENADDTDLWWYEERLERFAETPPRQS